MKKVQLIALVSLLALVPFRCALAQAGGTGAADLLVGNATARNQTTTATSAVLTEQNSNLARAS
jgi:hypothetical protein